MIKHGSSSDLPSLPSPPSIQGGMLFALNKWQEQVQSTVTWLFTQALLRAELTALLWSQGGGSIYYLWLEKCRGSDRHTWPSHGLRILRNCNNSLQRWLKGYLFIKSFAEEARGAWVKQLSALAVFVCRAVLAAATALHNIPKRDLSLLLLQGGFEQFA